MNWLQALIEISKDRRTPFQRWRDRIFLGIFIVTFFGIFFYGLYFAIKNILTFLGI